MLSDWLPRRARVAAFGLLLAVAPQWAVAATIGLNFTARTLFDGARLNSNAGYAPPDNAGGVGPTAVAQLINGAYAVYDKTNGSLLQEKSGRQFWLDAGVDPGTAIVNLGAFNQRILFDPVSGRWFAAALTGESIDNSVLVARSDTADPTGSWQAFKFLGNVGGTGRFVDFTRLGIDANGVYISTNNFTENSPNAGLVNVSIFSIPKADLVAAMPSIANMTRMDGVNKLPFLIGPTPQPVVNFNPTSEHAAILAPGLGNTPSNLLRTTLFNTGGPGATLSGATTSVPVSQFGPPPPAGQPDGTQLIGLLGSRIKANVYQVGNVLYAVHDVNVNGKAGIKWYKINESTNQLIQEGILSDPNFDYYQASIAANANGDVVIGFNRSGLGADGQISIFAAHGTTIGDVTTFGTPFALRVSAVDDYHYVNTRWGDYTTTVVDPSNPNVFWTFQAYALDQPAPAPNQDQWSWATNITQIIVPEPTSVALAAIALAAFAAAAWRRQRAFSRRAG
jgi:hypothetical protein